MALERTAAIGKLGDVLSFVAMVSLVYVAIAGLLFLMQSRLLFLPYVAGRALVATPEYYGYAYEDVELATGDGETLHGWYVPLPGAPDERLTVLIFHGNAGNISHRLDTLRIWRELGFNVLLFDYRGYGQSTGRASEEGTYRDARAAWRYLTGQRGIAADRIVLFGRSLGGAVAAALAAEVGPAALILESTFTSAPDLGSEIYWWLPVRLLARIDYDTRARLADVNCPVLIVHSRRDEIMPFAHAEALYAAAREPKRLLEIEGDHNQGFLLSGLVYRDGLQRFLADVLASRRE